MCPAQMLDDEGLQRFPASEPGEPLPRVVAMAPHLVPATATVEAFRELNLHLAQVGAARLRPGAELTAKAGLKSGAADMRPL